MTDRRPTPERDDRLDAELEGRLRAAFGAATPPDAPEAVRAEVARLVSAPEVRARGLLGGRRPFAFAAMVLGLFVVVAGSLLSVGSRPPPTGPADASVPAVEPSVQPSTAAPSVAAVPSASPSPTAEPTPWPEESMAPIADDVLPLAGRNGLPGRLYCNNRPFGFDGLSAPTGAEDRVGPEYDVLRSLIGQGVDVSWAPPGKEPTFREAARDPTGVVFLNDRAGPKPIEGGPYAYITLKLGPSGWAFEGSGDCQPRGVPGSGFGQATWTLDPEFAAPGADTRTLHLLVDELSCSGGRSASSRISPAFVVESRHQVAIELFVQWLPGEQDCLGSPPTPAKVRLPNPLGNRTLMDVGAIGLGGTGG